MRQQQTQRSNQHGSTRSSWAACSCALLAVACGGEDATSVGGEASVVNEALPGAGAVGPFYAIATEVYGADFSTSTSFIRLVPSLDVAEIDLASAREYNGRATVGTVGKWLFIMDGEQPIVERFTVGTDGSLTLDGELSFA